MDTDSHLVFDHVSPVFRVRRRFEAAARNLVRLPRPGEGSLDHLLPEACWQELSGGLPDPAGWFTALSQATGVYFFPSREWPGRFVRYLGFLGIHRLLEAGAGRGYLTAALGQLAMAHGMAFRAIDQGEGEFQSELPSCPEVIRGDVFAAAPAFRPEAVLYAWPPPGQSLAPLFTCSALRYIFVVGEPGGGITGAREDWLTLPQRRSDILSRFSRGRTGPAPHQVTIFWRGG